MPHSPFRAARNGHIPPVYTQAFEEIQFWSSRLPVGVEFIGKNGDGTFTKDVLRWALH